MMTFKQRVRAFLESEDFIVFEVADRSAEFDYISINPVGKVGLVKCQAHYHLNRPERLALLKYNVPVYIASEKWTPGANVPDIKMEKLMKGGK